MKRRKLIRPRLTSFRIRRFSFLFSSPDHLSSPRTSQGILHAKIARSRKTFSGRWLMPPMFHRDGCHSVQAIGGIRGEGLSGCLGRDKEEPVR